RLVATLGFDLLTGAGRGTMSVVSQAFFETSPRQGVVIGIVPATVDPLSSLEARMPTRVEYEPPPGYPNEWVEIAIYTHLPHSGPAGTRGTSRNHINVLSGDAIVALPCEEGTHSEMWLAIQYGVPTIAFGQHRRPLPPGIHVAESIEDVRVFLLKEIADF